jgi:thiol-disulfide isomerase/thioredoxin
MLITPTRRQLLQAALAAASSTVLTGASAQSLCGPACEVSPWPGPLSAFSLIDTSGKTWRLDDLKGRAVLLNFWASWCEPCRAEMPSLQALAERHGPDKLVVLTVNFKEGAGTAQRFVQRANLQLPVLLDPLGQTAKQWGARAFPTTILIGADGRVRGVVRGEVDWLSPQAAKLVEPLLAR